MHSVSAFCAVLDWLRRQTLSKVRRQLYRVSRATCLWNVIVNGFIVGGITRLMESALEALIVTLLARCIAAPSSGGSITQQNCKCNVPKPPVPLAEGFRADCFQVCRPLVYKCLHGSAPSYLVDELCQVADVEARQRLRSVSSAALDYPPSETEPFWNGLPQHVTSAPSLLVFRSRLKTHLFTISYPSPTVRAWPCTVLAQWHKSFRTLNRSCYLLTGINWMALLLRCCVTGLGMVRH